MSLSCREDLTGHILGRWIVLSFFPHPAHKCYWLCQCQCPHQTIKPVSEKTLRNGESRSCGCLKREIHTKHGQSRSRLYVVWSGMWQRCTNPKDQSFHNYGERGITVCERWQDFQRFATDVGPHPGPGYELKRINNNRGYFPGNVTFADRTAQSLNRRTNHYLTFGGRTLTLIEWATELHLTYDTLQGRIERGWTVERAFLTPV